jgi:hypothetical protein
LENALENEDSTCDMNPLVADTSAEDPYNKRLHNIFPGTYNTTCRICQKENESDKHFWIECEHKWSFRMIMMKFKKPRQRYGHNKKYGR